MKRARFWNKEGDYLAYLEIVSYAVKGQFN
jgi:hypothetical protein